jgi:hypothetical protein
VAHQKSSSPFKPFKGEVRWGMGATISGLESARMYPLPKPVTVPRFAMERTV